uniref:SEPTUM SITE-DETERMINING PROTEIN DIVIVA CELL DIVISION, SEPTATION, CELL.9A n=1 Tax=Siphoviridae sp. ctiJI15 TaxID=2826431 RepID=A0A8S5NKL8_9CAUD|nr:MAG TPA: SEPTUM SITE-DETERMINING PROTEIN DIVIVA CELL DIVISION, SEPTATION, CELL.9A [Siphoviridae sp. ctiJI15]
MSETKNLKLFKHEEPLETNNNKFDIDKALNQNWDKVDEYVEKVNTKIQTLETDNTKNEQEISNIQEKIGDIDTILDTINGEVI